MNPKGILKLSTWKLDFQNPPFTSASIESSTTAERSLSCKWDDEKWEHRNKNYNKKLHLSCRLHLSSCNRMVDISREDKYFSKK